MKRCASMSASRGMTLVELMVGLAVGLFVALVAISVFVSTRSLFVVSSSESRMSENSRLAMDILHTDLRNAGFPGCKPQWNDPPVSLLNPDSGEFLAAGTSGVNGFRATGAAFAPALSVALQNAVPPPDPALGSDVLSVRVPVDGLSLGLTATMPTTTAAPQVGVNTPGNTIRSGDIVLIASCQAGTIFQVTEPDPVATGVLTHAVGTSPAPGNSSANLQQRFRGDAAVYRLETRHYYIAPGSRSGTNSLWRFSSPNAGTNNAEEVASGIDRLVLDYGVDANDTRNVTRYMKADEVTAAGLWDKVLTARVQMLTATTKDGVSRFNQAVEFDGNPVARTDRRLRTALTEVVTLRGRAQ